MVGVATCYVPYCEDNKQLAECTFFKFLLNSSRCKDWVQKLGVEDFIHQPIEKLHELGYICSCHFRDKDYISQKKKRLKYVAVPSILDKHIRELPDKNLNNFPLIKTDIKPTMTLQIEMSRRYRKYDKNHSEQIVKNEIK